MNYKIKSEQTINDQVIADIVITAFEGGITYWCNNVVPMERDDHGDWYEMIGEQYTQYQRDGVGAYATPEFWHNDSRGYRLIDDEEGEIKKVLTASAIVKALHYQPPKVNGQSNNWYRKVVDLILAEEYDAGDADVVVQIAVLGELVYG